MTIFISFFREISGSVTHSRTSRSKGNNNNSLSDVDAPNSRGTSPRGGGGANNNGGGDSSSGANTPSSQPGSPAKQSSQANKNKKKKSKMCNILWYSTPAKIQKFLEKLYFSLTLKFGLFWTNKTSKHHFGEIPIEENIKVACKFPKGTFTQANNFTMSSICFIKVWKKSAERQILHLFWKYFLLLLEKFSHQNFAKTSSLYFSQNEVYFLDVLQVRERFHTQVIAPS